jgi:outer membrane protein OmpA-like peptidoglycan-associated protein
MKVFLFLLLTICGAAAVAQRTAYITKYDFVPGEKLIAFEDFSATEVGDFPLKWNTNATAEVVTLTNKPGKWLKINKESVFYPEFINNLPENFTLEFDLGINQGFDSQPFVLNITKLKSAKEYTDYYHYVSWHGTHTLHMEFAPAIIDVRPGNSKLQVGTNGNHIIDNNVSLVTWDNGPQNFAHVSLWRQKERLRIYLNGEKLYDIPRAFDSLTKYNAITIAMQGSYRPQDYYVVNNIRLAIGAPDTRNKLVTQGKFVTNGIRFSPNTDSLQPESFGVLKDIGKILKENPTLKLKIVGHTDTDGDDKLNLDLSKRRAEAVKSFLVQEYGIAADNLETDGKGESVPIDKNTTIEGKANNRRVEFVKLK